MDRLEAMSIFRTALVIADIILGALAFSNGDYGIGSFLFFAAGFVMG
ncbi:MAG TPA: hypothetical protein VGJ20_04205 [Xanthobacteraceae bacterium]|jgi:hypothetical protein